jgi:HD-GYP domain-containing protein (c-di-GMP phosphodiesterase class II)
MTVQLTPAESFVDARGFGMPEISHRIALVRESLHLQAGLPALRNEDLFVDALLERLERESDGADPALLDRWLSDLGGMQPLADYEHLLDYAFCSILSVEGPPSKACCSAMFSRRDTLREILLDSTAKLARSGSDRRENGGPAVDVLINVLASYDRSQASHAECVSRLGLDLATRMKLEPELREEVRIAGLVHDIGMVHVRRDILDKRAKLNESDWNEVHGHVDEGAGIVEAIPELAFVAPAVRSHHERFDGQGYPHGLAGDAIPLTGRILAVADAVQSMLSARPYRDPLLVLQIREILQNGKGTQWDPAVVDEMIGILDMGAAHVGMRYTS